ncbi:Hypothetical protein R9X50_00349000 [Acrodontium crateriforme]|uniref:Methyltransferase type 11 domain-containing protein n=1 Tax=Acrodontium crateriforme TaxID=150365 RepID=A0AAQ3R9X7_9PEZI|nr:Hypothetical protein R9X50_00349000 [Acrodontium crateriforme]
MSAYSTSEVSVKEQTFSKYDQSQSTAYAQIRRDYHPEVYAEILKQHETSGGKLDVLLDVGCGPGNVTRSLAPHFTQAIGLDPGEQMLATARSLTAAAHENGNSNITFSLSSAEALGSNLSPPIADVSVDLITAGNAAHWFDMAGFWASVARVLKPGGTVALWTSGQIRAHPSMPAAAEIQATMDEMRFGELLPYTAEGSRLTSEGYKNLPLPWTLEDPVQGFNQAGSKHVEWEPERSFYTGQGPISLEAYEKMMGTASAVTRWRAAHPDDIGTERDIVRRRRREMERILHAAGVEKGKEQLLGTVHGAIVIVKKDM